MDASNEPLACWDEEVGAEVLAGGVNAPGLSVPVGNPAGDGGHSTSGKHDDACTLLSGTCFHYSAGIYPDCWMMVQGVCARTGEAVSG